MADEDDVDKKERRYKALVVYDGLELVIWSIGGIWIALNPSSRFFFIIKGLVMDTLSDVSEYLNNLEAYLDDGDSSETRMDKIEKSEEELEMFEALERKSVVVESEKHRVVVFTKAPSRAYSKPFMRFSTPCSVDGQDHNLWDVIIDGDLEEEPAPTGDQSGPSVPPAPKTAKQLATIRNQERVKSILLLAIPDEYLLKFHNVADAKSLWEAIKSRFGGNVESKKMQKNVLKHQFENFSTASNESLDKAYD
ncbi:hypothetical protein Tco_1295342, partial [Tanacetum coccineum]